MKTVGIFFCSRAARMAVACSCLKSAQRMEQLILHFASQGKKRMADEAFHAAPSDVEVSEAIVALKKLAEQPEETSEAVGKNGKIGKGCL